MAIFVRMKRKCINQIYFNNLTNFNTVLKFMLKCVDYLRMSKISLFVCVRACVQPPSY